MADGSPLDQLSAVGIGDLNTTLKVANQNMSQLIQTIKSAFPQASSAVVGTATAGTGTLPANPTAFLSLTVNGTPYTLALYKP